MKNNQAQETQLFEAPINAGDFTLIQEPGKQPKVRQVEKVRECKGQSQYKIDRRWHSEEYARSIIKAVGSKASVTALIAHGKNLERERNQSNCMGVGEALLSALRGGLIASRPFAAVEFGEMNIKALKSGPKAGMIRVNWELHVEKNSTEGSESTESPEG